MICGIDEAGRGPVIGPLVVVICCCDEDDEKDLRRAGVMDSKLLTPERREELSFLIKKKCKYHIISLSPSEIDKAVFSKKENLNILEAKTMVRLIELCCKDSDKSFKVFVDTPTKNTDNFKILLSKLISDIKNIKKDKIKLICENKADVKYTIVGAASIIAKVERDKEIEKIKKRLGIDIGSGYPSDEKTQNFLKESFGKNYDFVRKSWFTFRKIIRENLNKRLTDFSLKTGFDLLEDYGFTKVPVKGKYEKFRYEGPASVIVFTTGKVVVQAPQKSKLEIEKLLKRLKLI